jgi:hypothetical protein
VNVRALWKHPLPVIVQKQKKKRNDLRLALETM